MINSNISELLGFDYEALEDDGSLGVIDTPFLFEDEDPILVYVEEADGKIRFFDDGDVIWHFTTLGVPLDEPGERQFIEELAAPHGVLLNDEGELEVWADAAKAPAAFARFISAMLEMVRWEREQNEIAEERRRQDQAADAETVAPLSA